jgi:hypothetical protein
MAIIEQAKVIGIQIDERHLHLACVTPHEIEQVRLDNILQKTDISGDWVFCDFCGGLMVAGDARSGRAGTNNVKADRRKNAVKAKQRRARARAEADEPLDDDPDGTRGEDRPRRRRRSKPAAAKNKSNGVRARRATTINAASETGRVDAFEVDDFGADAPPEPKPKRRHPRRDVEPEHVVSEPAPESAAADDVEWEV